jgi:predicted RNase H-like nuclease
MNFVGVDACRKGWFAVALDRKGNWNIGMFKTIDDLWNAFHNASLILIDIPIGLPDSGKRRCDTETRKILNRRASCVFPVPCRQALHARTYRQACRINQQVLGVKLTIQTWNISAKILEVDRFLRNNKQARRRFRESHPELCFWSLAGGHPMAYSKKKPRGFSERSLLLLKIYPESKAIIDNALERFMRKDLARDDILDALALAVCASLPLSSIRTVPPNPPTDKMGLPMEIVYFVLIRANAAGMSY